MLRFAGAPGRRLQRPGAIGSVPYDATAFLPEGHGPPTPRKKATTIALDHEADRLLARAARERGVSRCEFIRQQLALVLEQYRRHPKPRSAGVLRSLAEQGNESELFGDRQ